MSGLETLDVGQANELKLAFRRHGWTNEDVKSLCEGDILAQFLRVCRGFAEIKEIECVIDCDADPFLPEGWRVEQHLKSGSFKWDPTEVELYLDAGQKDGKVISGHELQKKLEGKRVLNANVLDWLLAHPQFIPESWKGKFVFFWGTIYRDGCGSLSVRYLFWNGIGWRWRYCWLVDYFRGLDPAALCK